MEMKVMTGGKHTDSWGRLAAEALQDEGAFTELYGHFFPRVYRYLLKKTLDSHLADELAKFPTISDQLPFRLEMIRGKLVQPAFPAKCLHGTYRDRKHRSQRSGFCLL